MIPPEAPEYTSEPKVLSPVSPKPVHYPVPANIPVLENQIDPVFNQTNTHMAEAASQQLPPPLHLDQQAGSYNHNAQHYQSSQPSEAYMTPPTGSDGQMQPPNHSQGLNQAHQAQQHYHMQGVAQEQAQTQTDSQTNQDSQVAREDENYSHQPAAVATVASSEASAAAPAYASSDNFHASAAPFAYDASFQSNNFHPQAPIPAHPSAVNATELPPGVDASNLQSLLNNLSQPAQLQATSYLSSGAEDPSHGALSSLPRPDSQDPQNVQTQSQQAQQNNYASTVVGANGLPPPPVASFQQPIKLESQRERKQAAGETLDEDDQPWTPETQRRYDSFLTEERKYVTEGNWEQFPYGSRLFVGNLSSERVTKRDIFHVFHKYGDLAQISIKQAYGFVQFLHSGSCSKAIQAEQGKTIRGKKIREFLLIRFKEPVLTDPRPRGQ